MNYPPFPEPAVGGLLFSFTQMREFALETVRLSEANGTGRVAMPKDADTAVLMNVLSTMYLEAHAPERLKVQPTRHEIIAQFLEETGQYVTNDASREAAIAEAVGKALTDADANAPWLAKAHALCTDQGIPQGHIGWRLDVLRGLVEDATRVMLEAAEKIKP